MELLVNNLLCWVDAAGEKSIERILAMSTGQLVVINISAQKGMPFFRVRDDVESAADAGLVYKVSNDPFARFRAKREEVIPTRHRALRDRAFELIASLVEDPDQRVLWSPLERGRLVREQAALMNVDKKVMYRHLKHYWQRGQTKNCLLPRYEDCAGPSTRIKDKRQPGEVKRGRKARSHDERPGVNVTSRDLRNIEHAIKHWYEGSDTPLTKVYDAMCQHCYVSEYAIEDGVPVPLLLPKDQRPTYDQFYYWFNKLGGRTASLRARAGDRKYNLLHRPILGRLEVPGPGALYQIDATVADVYLRSTLDPRRIIGRPVIYMVQDVFSRVVVGLYVGLEGPSWIGAMLALENAFTDKVEFCRRFGFTITEDDWPCHYLCHKILADRGEMLSRWADNLPASLGIHVSNTPPFRADWKGLVERQFGLANDVIHWVPGKVRKRERGDRDHRLDAQLDMDDFTQIMIKHVLTYNKHHRMDEYPLAIAMIRDGVSPYPLDLWRWGTKNQSGILREESPDIIRLHLLPGGKARVTREGLRFQGVFYSTPRAVEEKWYVKAGDSGSWDVDIAYDPRDASVIYLRNSGSRDLESCVMLDKQPAFKQQNWYEILEEIERRRSAEAADRGRLEQAQAGLDAYVHHTVQQSKLSNPTPGAGQSKRSQVANIRQNHKQERDYLREPWDMGTEPPVGDTPPATQSSTRANTSIPTGLAKFLRDRNVSR